jgi:hypothetical protein
MIDGDDAEEMDCGGRLHSLAHVVDAHRRRYTSKWKDHVLSRGKQAMLVRPDWKSDSQYHGRPSCSRRVRFRE